MRRLSYELNVSSGVEEVLELQHIGTIRSNKGHFDGGTVTSEQRQHAMLLLFQYTDI